MATGGTPSGGGSGREAYGSLDTVGRGRHERPETTETKAAYKTTEFVAYVAVLAGLLIAGLVVDGGDDPGSGGFSPNEVWLYAVILTFGYMVSRGLAKSGSRDPYTNDGGR